MPPIVDREAIARLPGLFWVRKEDPQHQARGKRTLQALIPVAVLGAVAGVVALVRGHHVMGTTSEISWGALIATYVFFAVSSTGLCLVSSLGHVFGFKLFEPITKRAILLAFIMLAIGFGVIGSELEHPFLLVKWVLISPNPSSPIWWMGTLYGVYFALLAAELYFLLRDNHHRARQMAMPKLVAAVAASSNLGAVFSLNHSRPFWYGPILPIYMIVTALVCGAALLVLVVYFSDFFTNDRQIKPENIPLLEALGKVLALSIGILVLVTAWRVIAGVTGDHAGYSEVTWAMLTGPMFFSFWLIEVFLGMGVPLALLLSAKAREPKAIVVAAALPLFAVFVMRLNLVVAGQMFSLKPVIGHLGELITYSPPFKGNPAGFLSYTPSLVETLIVAGAIAGAVLIYVVGSRLVEPRKEA